MTPAALRTITNLVGLSRLAAMTGMHNSLLRKKAAGRVRITAKDRAVIGMALDKLLAEAKSKR